MRSNSPEHVITGGRRVLTTRSLKRSQTLQPTFLKPWRPQLQTLWNGGREVRFSCSGPKLVCVTSYGSTAGCSRIDSCRPEHTRGVSLKARSSEGTKRSNLHNSHQNKGFTGQPSVTCLKKTLFPRFHHANKIKINIKLSFFYSLELDDIFLCIVSWFIQISFFFFTWNLGPNI